MGLTCVHEGEREIAKWKEFNNILKSYKSVKYFEILEVFFIKKLFKSKLKSSGFFFSSQNDVWLSQSNTMDTLLSKLYFTSSVCILVFSIYSQNFIFTISVCIFSLSLPLLVKSDIMLHVSFSINYHCIDICLIITYVS